jgi:CBS domain-containing protein
MYLLIIILDDLQHLPDLLAAWRAIGVRATLLNSQGGYRTGSWLDRVGLGGVNRLLQGDNTHRQRLLFSVLEDDDRLERAITVAERVVEGFDRPNSGIVFVLPVVRTLGLGKRAPDRTTTNQSQANRPGFVPGTPISKIVDTLGLDPSTVRRNDSLENVVEVMLSHPSVNVVGVVTEEGRLVGLIDMATLSEALFFSIFPESFLAELHDVETVMEFVKRPHDASTAGDIMQEAEFIHPDDTLMKAFKVLQRRKLEGIPIVDEHDRPIGYIHLVEVMEACVQGKPREGGAAEAETDDGV